ncbi:MAG: hypothetical protein J6Y41_02415 [Bacteroidaceae bacterium]|nr:hypothetical protein [Bacteroidaceae bacterium]
MACFDTDVNETAIKEIAKKKPYYFVMRDASMATDNFVRITFPVNVKSDPKDVTSDVTKDVTKQLSERQKAVLEMIALDPTISAKAISEKISE